MGMQIRRLNDKGIARFRDYLADLRKDGSHPVPEYLLKDKESSGEVAGAGEIEKPGFKTKRAFAEHIIRALGEIGHENVIRDQGLWTWLSLYYIDDICPANATGKRKPGQDCRYILDVDNWNRRYRLLLLAPYLILKAIPDHNRIFLDTPLSVHGELIEQVALGRLYLIRLPAVREIIDLLYFDENTGKAKTGIFPKKQRAKPGDLRNRLPIRIRQLQRTFDVASLTGDRLLELLGSEFQGWR